MIEDLSLQCIYCPYVRLQGPQGQQCAHRRKLQCSDEVSDVSTGTAGDIGRNREAN